MKLSEMTFEESRNAELAIVPEIEKIMENTETRELFDCLYATGNNSAAIAKRGRANKRLVNRLLCNHYESVCFILSILNHIDISAVKEQTRGIANKQISDLFTDMDLINFFMSPEALDSTIQSATSQNQE